MEWRRSARSSAGTRYGAGGEPSNREHAGIGGHIASFASAATLYDVGFNHFWKGANHPQGQDLVYIQGHCAPGIYSRAFLEGRISEEQLRNFRMETGGKGLSSYPHPWLMPDFWELPTGEHGPWPDHGDLSGCA